ncbi:hypothetical protein JCM11491_003313 [Sporobolomyces phaffii]
MTSNYAAPSTSTSTGGTTHGHLSERDSLSSGRFFNSNQSHLPQLAFAPPPPPPPAAASSSSSSSAVLSARPPLPHASSSTASFPNRMVFLDESASDDLGGGARGPGGATFLSDEETNASDSGSAFDRPLPSLQPHHGAPAAGGLKGKGKAVEGGGDDRASTANADSNADPIKKKKPVKTKKQTIGPDGKPVTRERKKKAGRACAACQKAHLTCDDGRPCKRCVKKGCPDECVDGARKKAKYLLEVPDECTFSPLPPFVCSPSRMEGTPPVNNNLSLLESPSSAAARPSQSPIPPPQALPASASSLAPSLPPLTSSSAQQPIFDFSSNMHATAGPSDSAIGGGEPGVTSTTSAFYDTNSFLNFGSSTVGGGIDHTQFGSEAANLEYAILSSMLNGNGFALDAHTPNLSGGIGASMGNNFDPRFHHQNGTNARAGGAAGGGGHDMLLGGNRTVENGNKDPGRAGAEGVGDSSGQHETGTGFGEFGHEKQDTEMFPATDGAPQAHAAEADKVAAPVGSGVPGLMTAEEALRNVTKPYPYAQSYHFLVKHLKTRFEKNDILRIVRALATFRPSLIALQMPLTEEDETFVERTFQRTLVELHKLISFSGTPTVVWRRTGEICLVGTEFCLLTGWKREELVGTGNVNGVTTSGGGRAGGGKYIFELFDTASVVEYYESFAKHAFESTSTSVTLQCVVLGPDGRPVPCAFCFSVRRDLFSCPFLIIGSFLPILV